MAPYMDLLVRSGAMWHCGRAGTVKPRQGLWSRLWNRIRRAGQSTSARLIVRSELLRPEKPRY
jgi:hypothetical protein